MHPPPLKDTEISANKLPLLQQASVPLQNPAHWPPQLLAIVLAAQSVLTQNSPSSLEDQQPHDAYICLKTEHRQLSALNIALSTTNTAHVPMSARRLEIANLSDTNATYVPLFPQKLNTANQVPRISPSTPWTVPTSLCLPEDWTSPISATRTLPTSLCVLKHRTPPTNYLDYIALSDANAAQTFQPPQFIAVALLVLLQQWKLSEGGWKHKEGLLCRETRMVHGWRVLYFPLAHGLQSDFSELQWCSVKFSEVLYQKNT